MSRRKQANPKAVKVDQDSSGPATAAICEELEDIKQQESDEEYDDLKPLLIADDLKSEPLLPPCVDNESDALKSDANQANESDNVKMTIAEGSCDENIFTKKNSNKTSSIESNTGKMSPVDTEAFQSQSIFPGMSAVQSATHGPFIANPTPIMSSQDPTASLGSRSSSPCSMTSMSMTPIKPGGGKNPSKARRKGDRNNNSTVDAASDLSEVDDDSIMPIAEGEEEIFQCPMCKMTVFSKTELTRHIRSHNSPESGGSPGNSCNICGKLLSSQSSLDRHMLVHSGERPFKCKVCGMAFTTNGNMHRHFRIHEKEGLDGTSSSVNATPFKDSDAKSSGSSGSSKKSRKSRNQVTNLDFPTSSSPSIMTSLANSEADLAPKRKLSFNEMEQEARIMAPAAKRRSIGENQSSGYAIMASMHGNSQLPVSNGSAFRKVKLDEEHNISGKLFSKILDTNGGSTNLQCPACQRSFLSPYGLDSHLQDEHPGFVLRCHLCDLPHKTSVGLATHMASAHKKKLNVRITGEKADLIQQPISKTEVPVGFQQLSFLDFSSEKFPLVARAWCEENPRTAGNDLHNYSCKQCHRSFPCRSALKMHSFSHSPEYATFCADCETWFSTVKERKEHEMQHLGQKLVGHYSEITLQAKESERKSFVMLGKVGSDKEAVNKEESDCENKKLNDGKMDCDDEEKTNDEKSDSSEDLDGIKSLMSQAEFMAVVGMKLTKPDDGKEANGKGTKGLEEREDAKVNEDYYVKLGRMKRPSKRPAEELNSLQELQKMLAMSQPRTNKSQEKMRLAELQRQQMALHPALAGAISDQEAMIIAQQQLELKSQADAMGIPVDHLLRQLQIIQDGYPLECFLCQYVGNDRKSLMAHFRAHNSDRPYQCQGCEYSCTTRELCEQHIRTKHSKFDKHDIDECMLYNPQPGSMHLMPKTDKNLDTTCYVCRQEFISLPALRMHHRTQSLCRVKPFICKLCDNSYSSKQACLRHIQSQHPDIDMQKLDIAVHVNETALVYQMRLDGDLDGMKGLASSRSRHMRMPLAMPGVSGTGSVQPAHTRSPSKYPGTNMDHTSAMDVEQPLDFSMKTSPAPSQDLREMIHREMIAAAAAQAMNPSQCGDSDQPIDLSTKSPAKNNNTTDINMNYSNNKHNTSLNDKFSHRFISGPRNTLGQPLQQHLRTHKEMVFRCKYCVASFTIASNMEKHMRSAHPQHANEPIVPSEPFLAKDILNQINLEENNNNVLSYNNKNSSYDQSDDLASVSKMISNTSAANLRSLLNVPSQTKPTVSLLITRNSTSTKQTTTQSGVSTHRLLNNKSPNVSVVKKEIDSDEDYQFAPLKIDIMESLKKEEMSKHLDRLKQSMMSPGGLTEGEKKKRNSYADSPHRLECPYCPRAFPWISSLNRHILTHTGQKPYKCPKCPVMFSTKSNRERHLVRKHGLNVLDPATRQMMDRPFKCHMCVFSSFSTAPNLVRHYQEKHPDAPLPEHLEVITKVEDIANLVMAQATRNSGGMQKPAVISLKELEQMGAKINGGMEDEDDEEEESMEDELESSGASNPDTKAILRKMITSTSKASPVFPGQSDDSARNTPSSDVTGVEPNSSTASLSNSSSAKNSSTNMTSMRSANNSTPTPSTKPASSTPSPVITPERAGRVEINPERDNYNVDKITACWFCNLQCNSRKALLKHLKEHSIDLPFKCYLCDASFNERLECLQHTINIHSPDWETLREKNQVSDAAHYALTLDCIVSQNFLNKGRSENMVAISEMDIAKIRSSLGDDLRPESDYAHRKVYCSLCPKRFWSLQDLRRHMRSHTGERPFECDVCQKRFTLKHSMMRHRRKHEGGQDFSSDTYGRGGNKIINFLSNHPLGLNTAGLGSANSGLGMPATTSGAPSSSGSNLSSRMSQPSLSMSSSAALHGLTPSPHNDNNMASIIQSVVKSITSEQSSSKAETTIKSSTAEVEPGSSLLASYLKMARQNAGSSLTDSPKPGISLLKDLNGNIKKDDLAMSASKMFGDDVNTGDMLKNLLGVEESELDAMLAAPSADSAAKLLGM